MIIMGLATLALIVGFGGLIGSMIADELMRGYYAGAAIIAGVVVFSFAVSFGADYLIKAAWRKFAR